MSPSREGYRSGPGDGRERTVPVQVMYWGPMRRYGSTLTTNGARNISNCSQSWLIRHSRIRSRPIDLRSRCESDTILPDARGAFPGSSLTRQEVTMTEVSTSDFAVVVY